MMKKTIEKMVKQEIQVILAENKDTIREIVKTSLVPELRAAVRETIPAVLKDLLKESPKTEDSEQVFNNEISLQGEKVQDPESALKKDPALQSLGLERQASDIGSESGRYLYCIAEGGERISLGSVGIQGKEVYTVSYKDLCAVVHTCSAEPYQSEDQEVVKHWVITHQKVVDEAWERFGTVLPMGFDTIIRGNAVSDPEGNMKNWLRDDYDNLKTKLKKLRDRAEYGVQVFWNTKIVAQKITEESLEAKKLEEEVKSKPKGLAYMYRQKLEELLKKEMEKQADRYFREFYDKIKPHANDLNVEKTKKTEDENKQMLMNLSCLLPKNGNPGLGDELEKIDGLKGFSVRFSGPWPPYSFV